ncbi:MAG: hypothetical protein AB8G05_04965 [Oligoflexales bacterium]
MRIFLFLFFLVVTIIFEKGSFAINRPKVLEQGDFEISEYSLDVILEKYLSDYINLALHYPRSFFPYYLVIPKSHEVPKFIYKDWCKNSKIFVRGRYKKKIKNIIYQIWRQKERHFSQVKPMEKFRQSLDSLDGIIDRLRIQFLAFRNDYDERLVDLLSDSPHLLADFNKELENIHKDSFKKMLHYRSYYKRQTRSYPGKILETKYMVDLVEGNHFGLDAVDLYNSIRELKSVYKNKFFLEISKASNNRYPSDGIVLRFFQPKSKYSKQIDSYGNPAKRHVMTPVADDYTYYLIRTFHQGDASLAKLIADKHLQRAVWRLRRKGFESLAVELESYVYNKIMHPGAIIDVRSLGGGISKSFKVEFPHEILGVYKPKAVLNFRQGNKNMLAYIAAGHKNEVAAFHMDRLLDLNMVPMTKLTVPLDNKIGSLQYYIKNTYKARDLSRVNPRFPIKNHKLSKGKGHSRLTNDIVLFDWIIDNIDRNLDNYLIQSDGQIILIDHGFSFVTSFYLQAGEQQLRRMFPSEKLAKKIMYLKNNPQLVPQAISILVGKEVANSVQKRINHIGHYLETYTQANPSHKKAIETGSGA